MRVTFDDPELQSVWRPVNDGVMGGRSSGGPRFEDDRMIFEGVINTNGGGFSSVRAPVLRGYLADMSALKLRVKSDGRGYKLTLRTSMTFRGRSVAFQAPIPKTTPGDWVEVSLPFSDLEASIFGRPIGDVPFDAADVRTIGIILSDGQDGPFKLELDWLEACP